MYKKMRLTWITKMFILLHNILSEDTPHQIDTIFNLHALAEVWGSLIDLVNNNIFKTLFVWGLILSNTFKNIVSSTN